MTKYFIAALCLILGSSDLRAQTAISQLPSASTPLGGSEVVAGVQSGTTVKVPVTAIGVQGPSSATSGHVATFNGTSGRIIQDGGVPGTVTSITCFGAAITTSGTCTTTGQLPGTATNDSASSGNVGQFISSTVLVGSAVGLTNNTPADVTSISLTAGDWDVYGNIVTSPGSGTTLTELDGWISLSSATFPTDPNSGAIVGFQLSFAATAVVRIPVGKLRVSVAAPTTVYLSTKALFGTSTEAAYGFLGARRVR